MTFEEMLYGDGSGRPLGLFANMGERRQWAGPLHPGVMTRQRRRAAARATKPTPRSKV